VPSVFVLAPSMTCLLVPLNATLLLPLLTPLMEDSVLWYPTGEGLTPLRTKQASSRPESTFNGVSPKRAQKSVRGWTRGRMHLTLSPPLPLNRLLI